MEGHTLSGANFNSSQLQLQFIELISNSNHTSIFGLHLSKIHRRCDTGRQRLKPVRRRHKQWRGSLLDRVGRGDQQRPAHFLLLVWDGPTLARKVGFYPKVECNNLGSRNSSRNNGSWQMTPKTVSRTKWRMDLRQLTVYEHFGCVNRPYARYNFFCMWTKVHVSCKSLVRIFPLA